MVFIHSEWSGQKSDYMKLRGGENVELEGVDFFINMFRNEGNCSLMEWKTDLSILCLPLRSTLRCQSQAWTVAITQCLLCNEFSFHPQRNPALLGSFYLIFNISFQLQWTFTIILYLFLVYSTVVRHLIYQVIPRYFKYLPGIRIISEARKVRQIWASLCTTFKFLNISWITPSG